MSLISELKRRNVFKVGAAYVVLSWLLAQITDVFLENFGAPEWVIKTVLMLLVIGFPLALFFAWAFEMTPEGIKKEKDVDRSISITHHTGRKLDFAIIAFLVLALGYFAFDKFLVQPAPEAESVQTEVPEEPKAVLKSIAVLPFVNMSDDSGNEYFSDGIAEEILNSLAKVSELQVAGRTSSFAFKGKNQDLRTIGEALGVSHILEGSVRKAGNKVRITAQLIRVDNGFHLWSESYDRELVDVFAIQDEIANAILIQLKAQLIGEEPQRVVTSRTNPEAYDFYLLARQRIYERSRLPLEAAAELLDRAIAIDPEYAPAYAQRSITFELLSEGQYGTIPETQAHSQSKIYADQALRLDPELAEGWAALGLHYQGIPGKLDQSIEALKRALAINPGMIDASNWLVNAYNGSNQPAKSLKLLQDLMQRDPLYKPGLSNLSFQYLQMGQRDKAMALIEKTRPFFPNDPNMLWLDGLMESTQGNIAASLVLLEEASRQQSENRLYRIFLSLGLLATHQYERVVEKGWWLPRVRALTLLDRVEEATIIARKKADEGNLGPYFSLLNRTDRSDELLRYLEARWPDLNVFQNDFPSNGYFGYPVMLEVALAYSRTGNQAKFDDAMGRVRAAHDSLAAQGLQNGRFSTNEAAWYAMAGDREKALQYLASVIDGGLIYSLKISDDLPFFTDYNGDPEYEAIQARMIEHLNSERQKLELKPVSA